MIKTQEVKTSLPFLGFSRTTNKQLIHISQFLFGADSLLPLKTEQVANHIFDQLD